MNHKLKRLYALLLMGMAIAQSARADGDVARGKVVFGRCVACHAANGSNGIGPHLDGVFGRAAGTVPGFRYSRGLSVSTLTWDESNLDGFLAAPGKVISGTTMPINVPSAQDRQDLIAYLKTFSAATR